MDQPIITDLELPARTDDMAVTFEKGQGHWVKLWEMNRVSLDRG